MIGDAPAAAELAYTVTVATLAIGFALLATAVSSPGAGLGFLPQAPGVLGRRRLVVGPRRQGPVHRTGTTHILRRRFRNGRLTPGNTGAERLVEHGFGSRILVS